MKKWIKAVQNEPLAKLGTQFRITCSNSQSPTFRTNYTFRHSIDSIIYPCESNEYVKNNSLDVYSDRSVASLLKCALPVCTNTLFSASVVNTIFNTKHKDGDVRIQQNEREKFRELVRMVNTHSRNENMGKLLSPIKK